MPQIPSSPELEEGCLGCMLAQPGTAVTEFVSKYPAGAKLFWEERHRVVLDCLTSMVDEGKHIDSITLSEELKKRKQLSLCGGLAGLEKLWGTSISAAGLDYYADQLRELYADRCLIQLGDKLRSLGMERKGRKALEEAEREVLAIGDDFIQGDDIDLKAVVHAAIDQLEASFHRGIVPGIKTGKTDLDELIVGLQPGELILLAARPSKGKTSLAMNIVEYIAIDQKIPVGVFSMEMPRLALVNRLLSSVGKVNLRRFRPGIATNEDFDKVTRASMVICGAPLKIEDRSGLSISELRALARRMVQRHGAKLIVVDYIQLMRGSGVKDANREQEVSEVSRGLKAMANELKLPVLALSQLNRAMETDGREPRLSDLRESGSLEQDADMVLMIHDITKDETLEDREVKLFVRKNRNGATGWMTLLFKKGITRFEDHTKQKVEI